METAEGKKFYEDEAYHKKNYENMIKNIKEQMAVLEEKYKEENVFSWDDFFDKIKDKESADLSAYIKEEFKYMTLVDRLTVKTCVGVLVQNEVEKKKYGFTY